MSARKLSSTVRRFFGPVSGLQVVVAMAVCGTVAAADESSDIRIREAAAFLRNTCVDCHSGEEPAGDRDLQTLDLSAHDPETQRRLQEVIDELTLGTMPPPEDIRLPDEARVQAIEWMTELVRRMRSQTQSTGGRTVLRRLNKREYRNTVADLLGLDLLMFDPTEKFPDDVRIEHLDTIGDALVTSGYLLDQYVDAAGRAVDRALRTDMSAPERTWKFDRDFVQQQELSIAHRKAFGYRYLCLYDHPLNDKPEGAYGPLAGFREGVPFDGDYEIRVLAEALHRDTPYGPAAVRIELGEPFRLGIRPGDSRIDDQAHTQPTEPLLAEAVLQEGGPEWYTFRVPLDQGFAPRFTFENGMTDVRGSYNRVFRHHKELLPKEVRNSRGIVEMRNAVIRYGQLPHIRIHEVVIRGPLRDTDSEGALQEWLNDEQLAAEDAELKLLQFAKRAFRRALTDREQQRITAFFRSESQGGQDVNRGFRNTLIAVLSSPEFLYFQSPDTESDRLSDSAIAERIAYLLTSTMPDERLMHAAEVGGLAAPARRLEEARRLLALPASERFAADFCDAWLGLHALGSMPPDARAFEPYYAGNLKEEMKRETALFFRDLLDRNAPTAELLTASHSFVNRDLARLYGVADQVPSEQAAEFHRVEFDSAERGGLLTQASVLTVSANGIETSPVMRGVWLSECLFNSPPPPPPDDVPAIDPDVRGATSIRERLDRHRSDAACMMCHRRIDPPGFALEVYDPIGRLRRFYDSRRRISIDPSGTMSDGFEFRDVRDLKQHLVSNPRILARALLEKLAAYALGRRIESSDRGSVELILDACAGDGYRLKDLLEELIASDMFVR